VVATTAHDLLESFDLKNPRLSAIDTKIKDSSGGFKSHHRNSPLENSTGTPRKLRS